MEANETNLRVMRTKEAIKSALLDLSEENGLDTITVIDLTLKAKINRGTFYLHYENLENLIDECYEDFISMLYDLFEMKEEDLFKKAGWHFPIVDPISPFIVSILKFIKYNRKLYTFLWITQSNTYYRTKLRLCVRDILFYDENALINNADLHVPDSYYFAYVYSSFKGVIAQWAAGNCQESPEEIAEVLSTLNHKGIIIASGSQERIAKRREDCLE